MSRKITVTHEGADYSAFAATVKSTFLGTEDHGIFTCSLTCEGSGTGVSVGNYGLDAWNETAKTRLGAGIGIDLVKEILHTVGAPSWEALIGKHVLVLTDAAPDGPGLGGRSVGLAHATDESRVLVLPVWFAAQKAAGRAD